MQLSLFALQRTDLQSIRDRLGAVFGKIRGGRRPDPTSQFVRAFIGCRTYDEISDCVFARLVRRFRNWDDIADAPADDIEAVLRDITFPERKAPELKLALREIRIRRGAINLEFLADYPVEAALSWLEELHGVGRKTAAATLNFSTLCKRAFVVDTHVLRVMRRFGLIGPKADEIAAFAAVMAADDFDADDLYELHWYLKRLGQKTCTHFRALCAFCPLSDICMRRIETGAIAITGQSDIAASNCNDDVQGARGEKAKIADLKAFLAWLELENSEAHTSVPLGHGHIDACLQGGLRRGALHDISAEASHEAAATGFAAALSFRMAADKRVLWIRQDFSTSEFGEPTATGFLELGLDPSRLLLLRLANVTDVLRAASDALSCAALGSVVAEVPGNPKILDMVASRRLTLASAKKGVTAFLLRFTAEPCVGTAETSWRIRASRSSDKENWGFPAFAAELVRNRHGPTGDWVMEWSSDDGSFREPCDSTTADSGVMVSPPSDRSIAAIAGTETTRRIA